MEKQTLEKIYKLRKINADSEWKEKTRNIILEKKDASLVDSFFVYSESLFTSSFGMIAIFMMFLLFTVPIIGVNHRDYEQVTLIDLKTTEQPEDVGTVTEEKDQVIVKAEEPKPIKQEFATVEETYRELQLAVLASKTGKQEKEEIAKELISEIERRGAEEMISMLGIEEEDDDSEALKDMKQAYEEGDYNKVFDIYIEEL
jgi:hypothetical protein